MPVRKVVTDHYAEHLATCQQHWEQALEIEGFDCALIHSGSQIISFLDDYHYPFRPNPHFLYCLPLTHHHDSALLVRPGQRPVLFYYQPDDYWYLPPSDPEAWWADHFEIQTVTTDDAWKAAPVTGRTAWIGDAPALASMATAETLNPARLINRMHLARTRKTDYEIACMTEASRLAALAHVEAERAFREGCSEYEIHLRYCRASGLLDHELPYNSIVALNHHGAVLHYQDREHTVPSSLHSFLIDGGATVHGYASDITRTYAATAGEFADLIEAVNTMQLDLCNSVKVGVDYRDLHLETHSRIAVILNDFDLIRVDADEAVESGLTSVFFPHGLGHYVGLQTHDVAGLIGDAEGTPIPRPEGHPFLRLTRILEAGNVLTIEPGIYFIDTLLRKWKANGNGSAVNWDKVEALKPCGGIRIEDNVVVRQDGPVNLSRRAFAAI